MPMRASELFARSQGADCAGPERCHWCYAPCAARWPHDDLTPVPYVRSREGALNPGGRWACEGCRLYRRPSVTAWWLTEGLKDRQCLKRLSWWVVPDGARAVRKEDHGRLWELLLKPPLTFCLALREREVDVQLHLAAANEHETIAADTVLYFTVDNVAHDYTVYELKESCKFGPEGKSPGVRAIHRVLGTLNLPDEKHVEGRRGRPPKHEDDDPRRVISKKAG